MAFKVFAPEVDRCADELVRQGVKLLSPPAGQAFGHRTLFFRDPDGNLLEVITVFAARAMSDLSPPCASKWTCKALSVSASALAP
jgi:Glyoxalase/Bleomycin resistance protein/Dioxygenase superfamily